MTPLDAQAKNLALVVDWALVAFVFVGLAAAAILGILIFSAIIAWLVNR